MTKEEIEALQAEFKLTDEELIEYEKAVNLFFTTGKKSVDNPKLVFVAGQAGAGKSKLIPVVNEQLEYNAVISDYDIVRSLHPKFAEASKKYPENVHFALLPDADAANEYLRHYCRDNNLNLIYEGTMRGTAVFIQIATEFKQAGYEVDLSLMAVPKLESYGSTLLRYATDLLQNNAPRWVPKQVHDQSYDNFLVTLQELENQELFDKADVYRRGSQAQNGKPVLIYSAERRPEVNKNADAMYYSKGDIKFKSPIEAIKYGRDKYKTEAVIEYPSKFELVKSILEEKAPDLLVKLEDWKNLYRAERQEVLNERMQNDR